MKQHNLCYEKLSGEYSVMSTVKKVLMTSAVSLSLLTSVSFAKDLKLIEKEIIKESQKIAKQSELHPNSIPCATGLSRLTNAGIREGKRQGLKRVELADSVSGRVNAVARAHSYQTKAGTGCMPQAKVMESARIAAGVAKPAPGLMAKVAPLRFTGRNFASFVQSPRFLKGLGFTAAVLGGIAIASNIFKDDKNCRSAGVKIQCSKLKNH